MTNLEKYSDKLSFAMATMASIIAEKDCMWCDEIENCEDMMEWFEKWLDEEADEAPAPIDWETVQLGTKIRDKESGDEYDFIAYYRGCIYATVIGNGIATTICSDVLEDFEIVEQ